MKQRILVWDLPTRIFHWSLVASFTGAYLTADSEFRVFHVLFGYTMLGLLNFRIVWGIVGSRYVRFVEFLSGCARLWTYLRKLFSKAPEHYVGHNPAGALAIVMLIGLGLSICISGLMAYDENFIAGMSVIALHDQLAQIMLMVVGVHIFGAIASSYLHRENLIGAMITGRKHGEARHGIGHAHVWIGALLGSAIVSFWLLFLPNNPFSAETVDSTTSGITTEQIAQDTEQQQRPD